MYTYDKDKYDKKVCKFDKLVRDKIPQIIESDNKITKTYICNDAEYYIRLQRKLQEEVDEFLENPTTKELADILEVVYALAKHRGTSKKELEKVRIHKAHIRGAFDKKIVLLEARKKE